MDGFARDELARRGGLPAEFVDELVELGVLSPRGGDRPFSSGDVRRARFVHGLEQGGVPVGSVAAAIRDGALSLAFLDASYWDRLGGLAAQTYEQLSAQTGLSLDLLGTVRESMGYARPGPDDQVRENELDVVPLVQTLIGMGVDPTALERHLRTWGESTRRIAEADAAFYSRQLEKPLLHEGLTESDMLQATSAASEMMVPHLEPALLAFYYARSEHTWMANIVEAVEATLERMGLHRSAGLPPAMCFLDLSGYTRLTEQRGDEYAANIAGTLSELVQRSSHERKGRPVKWLGDGVMVYFAEPAPAVGFSLDMVEQIPAAELPPVHVGIAAGPLILQDGDYFGRTVNIAARIAALAQAGQVLVSDRVVETTSDPRVEFAAIGDVELKGVSGPVALHLARRKA